MEDYCTEALAWCLGQSEDVVQKFLALTGIEELRGYRGPIAVATQQSFKGSGDEDDEEEDGQSSGGRFDLGLVSRNHGSISALEAGLRCDTRLFP